MKKIIINFILSLFIICFSAHNAAADITLNLDEIDALKTLTDNVTEMAKEINHGSSKMMKYADMLICSAKHGRESYSTFSIAGIISISVHLISIFVWLAGWILLILGFFIMMLASLYMFDVSFNIAIVLVILPLGFALWPFGWTRDKLKPMIDALVHYTGVFIFLPLGIHIGVTLVEYIMNKAINSDANVGESAITFEQAFIEDRSDLISDNLGVTSLGFWMLFIAYLIAMRLIPLMATEFCDHFFGESLAGSPINDKITQAIAAVKKQTLGRAGKLGKDIAKHKMGNHIKGKGKKDGNFLQRAIYRYGKNMANTKKRR